MQGVLVIKNVSVKLFSFFNGGIIWSQGRVCETLQLLQWMVYLVIKIVSVKIFSFINGGSIGDQERVCQTLQLLYWREYWWSRTCLSNSSASLMEGVLVIKNVSVKLFSFFSGGIIGDHERVCQNFSFFNGGIICGQGRVCETLQLLQWMVYWWSRSRLSNSSTSSVEAVLVIKNVSVKISASLMEGVLVIKNVSVKLFSFFSGGIIGDHERVCQNFSFINGGSIGDQERVCQTLQFLQWRHYLWSRTCLSKFQLH